MDCLKEQRKICADVYKATISKPDDDPNFLATYTLIQTARIPDTDKCLEMAEARYLLARAVTSMTDPSMKRAIADFLADDDDKLKGLERA